MWTLICITPGCELEGEAQQFETETACCAICGAIQERP
jgi:hypothetical protein